MPSTLLDEMHAEAINALGERFEHAIRIEQMRAHPTPEPQMRALSDAYAMFERRLSGLTPADRGALLAALSRELDALFIVGGMYADILALESRAPQRHAA